jgi:four helix bundle protein
VYRLVREHPGAHDDRRYRGQLFSSAESVASNIAEGFVRYSAADFVRFLDYALASLVEAQSRLEDGVGRGYFDLSACGEAQRLGRRTFVAALRLKQSQQRYAAARRDRRPT